MLFLVATPIGNLSDFSQRAIDTLKSVDLILCEDTRHSQILLKHYQIQKPLQSHHQFNEKKTLIPLLTKLKEGQNIALISDAGTPAISDPGSILCQACIEEKILFTVIPGACSVTTALLLSGLPTEPFQFMGFIPLKKTETFLQKCLFYSGTTLCFESPKRLCKTLEKLKALVPDRPLAVLRELTKTFEEALRGTPTSLLEHFEKTPPKGEIILAIGAGSYPEKLPSLEELIPLLKQEGNLSLKEAIHLAAKLTGHPKKDVYRSVHQDL